MDKTNLSLKNSENMKGIKMYRLMVIKIVTNI